MLDAEPSGTMAISPACFTMMTPPPRYLSICMLLMYLLIFLYLLQEGISIYLQQKPQKNTKLSVTAVFTCILCI